MSTWVERVARTLAQNDLSSRRGLIVGDRPAVPAVGDPTGSPTVGRQARTSAHAAPAASAADKQAMRAALAHATPTRDELLGFVQAMRKPGADGRFTAAQTHRIRVLQVQIGAGYRQVENVRTHSRLRADVLSLLSETAAMVRTLAAMGQKTDAARGAHLRTVAEGIDRRMKALEQIVAPALRQPHKRKRQ